MYYRYDSIVCFMQYKICSTWQLQELVSHLKLVFQDKDDELECGPVGKGHLVQDLLSAPALLLQCVAHDTRRPVEPRVEVKRHIGPRLHAAATCEIYLEPVTPCRGTNVETLGGSNTK